MSSASRGVCEPVGSAGGSVRTPWCGGRIRRVRVGAGGVPVCARRGGCSARAFKEFEVHTADSNPHKITVGRNGNVWFTEPCRRQDRADHTERQDQRIPDPHSTGRTGRDSRPVRTATSGSPRGSATRSGGSPRAARSPSSRFPLASSPGGSRRVRTATSGSPRRWPTRSGGSPLAARSAGVPHPAYQPPGDHGRSGRQPLVH